MKRIIIKYWAPHIISSVQKADKWSKNRKRMIIMLKRTPGNVSQYFQSTAVFVYIHLNPYFLLKWNAKRIIQNGNK